MQTYEDIKQKYNIEANKGKNIKPKLIYKSEDITLRILTDLMDQGLTRIITNNKTMYSQIEEKLKKANKTIKVDLQENVLDIYNLNQQLESLQSRKIWLKCGGFITIDKTEALTAIDVNSGKYTGKKDLEQTIFTVNKEATVEIAKQLRLRDIGGIIIIDYIDMQNKENEEKIIKIFEEQLKKDRSKTQIVGFSKLNLLEMTRKHMCSND